ncbi:MAG: MerR family transcriptional regulator [Anaerolineae bacterium]
MAYTVKAVADMANVSVRALHHYDHIGLLKPASVSPAGYRLYTDADLERLQQILFFRELGFPLQEIKAVLDSPGFDRKEALIAHRRILLEKRHRLDLMVASLDRTIDAVEREEPVESQSLFEGFDRATEAQYREEARQRWGSEVVDESYRRVSQYSKEQWDAVQAEYSEIYQVLAGLMDRDPSDPEVQAYVDRHFRAINANFYTCSLQVFRGLGEMYVADGRFTAFYEKIKPGLAQFLSAAMSAYCDKAEASAG